MVDHGGGPHDPRVRRPRQRVTTFFSAEHGCFLLGPADEQRPFGLVELSQELVGDIVFALPLGKVHDRHALVFGEAVEAGDEALADRLQQR